jgi:hypothetical protein
MKNLQLPCAILKDLSSELDLFRSSNQFSARIPQSLRESILCAIDDGVGANDIRKFLKVGDAQIKAWRKSRLNDDKLAIKTAQMNQDKSRSGIARFQVSIPAKLKKVYNFD